MASLQTPLCHILHIDTPIVQAPIGPATNPVMTAAVSNAGGLGMLAFLSRDADDVRRLIGETLELTNRPFGANFILRGLEETDDRLDACLESGVTVVSFHWNEPYEYIDRIHDADTIVMYTVGSAQKTLSEPRHQVSTLSWLKAEKREAMSGAMLPPWLYCRQSWTLCLLFP